jgi:ABC-type microcin C transport system permease subunit YejE
MEFVIPVIDTFSLIIGINIGVAVGYWSYWFLFGRDSKEKTLLEVPPK